VSRDVTTFVIRVDGKVKTHQFNKVLVVFETKKLGEVVRVILVTIDGRELTILVDVTVDTGSNIGKLGNQVHGIFKGRIPVLGLVDTLRVGLGELRIVLESIDSKRELGHGVEGLGTTVNEFLNEFRNLSTSSPLSREVLDLVVGGDFTGNEQPEEGLRKRLTAFFGTRKHLLAVRDGQTTETDTFLSIENGTFPDKTLNTTHTTIGLVKSDFTKNLGSIFLLEFLDLGLCFRNDLSKTLLQRLYFDYTMVKRLIHVYCKKQTDFISYLGLGRIGTSSTNGGSRCETSRGLTSSSLMINDVAKKKRKRKENCQ
jgi:hypothetical protein